MKKGKILIAIAGLAAGLLLGEVGLRLVAPQVYRRPRVWAFDEYLGWRHLPGASGRLVSPEFDVEISINADGLRDRDYVREKADGTWRILAFGDSFVEGWGVEVDSSVSKRLERFLQDALPGREVEVINFGVAGYGTDQEMLFFDRLGRRYHPDLVLVFFYANDLWNNVARRGIGAERGLKPYFRPGPDGRLRLLGVPVPKIPQWDESWWASRPWQKRLSWYLHQHCHLYALLEKAMAQPEVASAQRRNYYLGLYGRDPEKRWEPAWDLTGRLLEAFGEKVAQSGARMLLVYAPAIVQVEEEDWKAKKELAGLVGDFDLRKPNRRLADFSRRFGFALLDLYPDFAAEAKKHTLYFRDSHWNARGHALAAERIGRYLLEEKIPEEGNGP